MNQIIIIALSALTNLVILVIISLVITRNNKKVSFQFVTDPPIHKISTAIATENINEGEMISIKDGKATVYKNNNLPKYDNPPPPLTKGYYQPIVDDLDPSNPPTGEDNPLNELITKVSKSQDGCIINLKKDALLVVLNEIAEIKERPVIDDIFDYYFEEFLSSLDVNKITGIKYETKHNPTFRITVTYSNCNESSFRSVRYCYDKNKFDKIMNHRLNKLKKLSPKTRVEYD